MIIKTYDYPHPHHDHQHHPHPPPHHHHHLINPPHPHHDQVKFLSISHCAHLERLDQSSIALLPLVETITLR